MTICTRDGVALEWKYLERYLSGRPDFKGKGISDDTRRRRYSERYHSPFSSFDPAAVPDMDDFLYEPFYQIMRQRLLSDRMVRERELAVYEAKGGGGAGGELALRSLTAGHPR